MMTLRASRHEKSKMGKDVSFQMMIKKIARVMCAVGATFALAACGNGEPVAPHEITGTIDLVTRDEGSGTRAAFNEMLGITQDGVDQTTLAAIVQNGTDQVMTLVATDPGAIGYISLGSLNDTVKPLNVDQVEPTEENVLNGTYKLYRPFTVITNKARPLSEVSKDFLTFIQSKDGQAIVRDAGYVPIKAEQSYQAKGLSGNINISGSTSVGPVMESLAEAYQKLNPKVSINITQNGSSAGIQAARQGSSDFGISSRQLTDAEQDLTETVIANDGIVVIVNKENARNDITSAELQKIYLGKVSDWEELRAE
ncbi:MAG: extracellular solute-binding protein [Aerococcus sp.]|nr:extracellular solute-binding protein [Aerococcus sp.]